MTSKISFFKMVKQDCRRRMWIAVVLGLLFAAVLPIAALMNLQRYEAQAGIVYETEQETGTEPGFREEEKQVQDLQEDCAAQILGIADESKFLISLLGAVMAGISGFSYLHSRKKQDLFHSIPVRREILFLVQQASGFLLWLAPFLGAWILTLLAAAVKGILTGAVWAASFQGLGLAVLVFLLPYETVILAMLLTGKLLTAVLGMGVFFLYGPFLTVLAESYLLFFQTYTPEGSVWWNELSWITPLAPVFWVLEDGRSFWRLSLFAAAALFLFFFGMMLYRIRPTERAEQSMAFVKSQTGIRWALVIPLSLGAGQLACGLAYRHEAAWLCFGILAGVVILSGVVEVIYSFDFRKAFSHWKQMVLMAAASLAVGSIFVFDLTGYDTWLPEESEVESMAVEAPSWQQVCEEYYFEEGTNGEVSLDAREQMEIRNFGPVYEMAREGASQKDQTGDCTQITVWFHMKSGKTIGRQYLLPVQMVDEGMEKLMEDPDYLRAEYPILTEDISCYQSVSFYGNNGEMLFGGTGKVRIAKFAEAYRADLQEQETESWKQAEQLGILKFESSAGSGSIFARDYPVDTTFVRTLECLEEMGVTVKRIQDMDVAAIRAEYCKEDGGWEEQMIEDPQQIALLLPQLTTGKNGWGERLGKESDCSFELLTKERESLGYAYLKESLTKPSL